MIASDFHDGYLSLGQKQGKKFELGLVESSQVIRFLWGKNGKT
jgi:hypothetical protein